MTVSASYPKRQNVFLGWALVCLLTSFYVFFLRDGTPHDNQKPPSDAVLRWDLGFLRRYWTYMTGILGILTMVAGLTAASAVFVSRYLNGTAWSRSNPEMLAFVGAVAAAFVAGGTAGRLAGNKLAEPVGGGPETPPETPAEAPVEMPAEAPKEKPEQGGRAPAITPNE